MTRRSRWMRQSTGRSTKPHDVRYCPIKSSPSISQTTTRHGRSPGLKHITSAMSGPNLTHSCWTASNESATFPLSQCTGDTTSSVPLKTWTTWRKPGPNWIPALLREPVTLHMNLKSPGNWLPRPIGSLNSAARNSVHRPTGKPQACVSGTSRQRAWYVLNI